MGLQFAFSSGSMWGERTDVTGSGIGPVPFGILQSGSVDFDFTDKPLMGQYQFPVAVARGQGKITGKATFAQILGAVYSQLFFGATTATGMLAIANNEAAAVPSATPYAVTVANASAFDYDLGVIYASGVNAGNEFTRVTTPSAAGQYSVNAATGVYTFSGADAGAALSISYAYNTTTSGSKITITNQLAGFTPTFRCTMLGTYNAQQVTLELNACVASKLTLQHKVDDWTIPEMDFSAYADASGTIGYLSTAE